MIKLSHLQLEMHHYRFSFLPSPVWRVPATLRSSLFTPSILRAIMQFCSDLHLFASQEETGPAADAFCYPGGPQVALVWSRWRIPPPKFDVSGFLRASIIALDTAHRL
jgi:hypothetical protein